MTCFLTYSVNGVRIASDISIQSEFIPLINVYFIFSMVFTLVSMIWYVILNSFATKRTMPRFLIRFAELLEPLFVRKRHDFSFKEAKEAMLFDMTLQKVAQLSENDFKETVNDVRAAEDEQKVVFGTVETKKKNSLNHHEEHEDSQKVYERRVDHFNYFVLFVAILTMAVAQVLIWTAIAL